MIKFRVFPYDIKTLREKLAAYAHDETVVETVRCKPHDRYLEGYLAEMGALSFVVETPYIDKDYLEDHAAYYVRCFWPYKRFCSRVHFFKAEFTQDELTRIVEGAADEDLFQRFCDPEAYIGFLVIRPLPETFIGRTCLRTYPPGDGKTNRNYPALAAYETHIAGIALPVESVAYQEQDVGVAACATTALWSAFQVTARRFQHPILSPAAITRAATDRAAPLGRVFPSPGLSLAEMCEACHAVSLEAELFSIDAGENDMLPGLVYGYLSAGLPLVLLAELVDRSEDDDGESLGLHAVTVCGFNLSPTPKGIFTSGRVNKLYAHDDQVGPFARMEVAQAKVKGAFAEKATSMLILTTSWNDSKDECGGVKNVVAVPRAALIPLYHKIRMTATTVMEEMMMLNDVLNIVSQEACGTPPTPDEWDITLRTVCEVKREWRDDPSLAAATKASLLRAFLPRFMWWVRALYSGKCVFEVLTDATDTSQGVLATRLVVRDATFTTRLQEAARKYEQQPGAMLPALVGWFAAQ